MNRRKLIKQLAIASGAIITLPQWMISCGLSDSGLHQSSFSNTEQQMLASITDTIIPAGNSIGALAVEVDKFLQKLLDDCYETEVKNNVKKQILALDTKANVAHKKSFKACAQSQREALLLAFSVSEKKEEKEFFDMVKSETIRGFNTSQQVMQDFLGYMVAPGHYHGCVDVQSKDHA